MKFFRRKERFIPAILLFLFSACNHWTGYPPHAGKDSGVMIPVKIQSISAGGYGAVSGMRSSGSEQRIAQEPIVLAVGDDLLAEITIEEDLSALRESTPKDLEDGKKFRVIVIKHDDKTYLSHADFEVGKKDASENYVDPNLVVPQGVDCDFICYSYNSEGDPTAWTVENDPLSLSLDLLIHPIDLLLDKKTAKFENGDNSTLSFSLTQQFTKVKLILDASLDPWGRTFGDLSGLNVTKSSRENWNPQNLSNTIALTVVAQGILNLGSGSNTGTSESSPFSGWPNAGSTTTNPSDEITFFPGTGTGSYTLTFPAELPTTIPSGLNVGNIKMGAISIPYSTFEAGKIYTLKLRSRKKVKFAASNINWSGEDHKHLEFDEYNSPGTIGDGAAKQGVYFLWGSLIGIVPVGSGSAWNTNSNYLYIPVDFDNLTHEGWECTSAYKKSWSWPTGATLIPHVSTLNVTYQDNTIDERGYSYLKNMGNGNKTSYVGDVCTLINSDYRLPYASEFGGISSTILGDVYSDNTVSSTNLESVDDFGWTNIQLADNRGVTTQWSAISGSELFYFPASGFMDPTTGNYTSVGSVGCYWSGSVDSSSNKRYAFRFSGTTRELVALDPHCGCSVRCVYDPPTP